MCENAKSKVWYRQVGGYWIAYRGDRVLWEAPTRADLMKHLDYLGIAEREHVPLAVVVLNDRPESCAVGKDSLPENPDGGKA